MALEGPAWSRDSSSAPLRDTVGKGWAARLWQGPESRTRTSGGSLGMHISSHWEVAAQPQRELPLEVMNYLALEVMNS